MSKGKRIKSAAGGSTHTQRWDMAITSAPFAEEGVWTACTALIVANRREDIKHVSALVDAVNAGHRKLFKVITQESLFAEAQELGNPKGKKPKDIPLNIEVCEACKPYLDANEEIPLALLAKLIKYKLLDLKQKDLNRRDAEKKLEESSGRTSKASEKASKKGDKKDGAKSAKGKAEKKLQEPQVSKVGSKLRKRGEEEFNIVCLDDEPDDGPEQYVIVSGFNNPHLFSHLADIGVFIDSVVELKTDEYIAVEAMSDIPSDDLVLKDEKQIALEEEQLKTEQKQRDELALFWRDAFLLLKSSVVPKLKDVARLVCTVENSTVPVNMDDVEQRLGFQAAIFEEIAVILFNLVDSKRQWQNYLRNLKLAHVPAYSEQLISLREAVSQPSASPIAATAVTATKTIPAAFTVDVDSAHPEVEATDVVDLRLYTSLMNCVPLESVSVHLIIHCMLEQVEASEDFREMHESPKTVRQDGLDDGLAQYISQMAMKLGLSEQEEQVLAAEFDFPPKAPPPATIPQLVSHRDEVAQRLRHLAVVNGFDVRAAELAMIQRLASAYEMPDVAEHACVEKERAARTQEMLSFMCSGNTTTSEIDHAFKQFIFEGMKLTSTEMGVVQGTDSRPMEHNPPWDDPYPYYKHMIPETVAPKEEWEIDDAMGSVIMAIRSAAEERQSKLPSWGSEGRLSNAVLSIDGSGRDSSAESQHRKASDECAHSPSNPLYSSSRVMPPATTAAGGGGPDKHSSVGFSRMYSASSISSAGTYHSQIHPNRAAMSGRTSSVQSVHFETDHNGEPVAQPGDEPDTEVNVRDHVSLHSQGSDYQQKEVNDTRVRSLDEWCFSEHLAPHILQQVLIEASYELPYMDSYHDKRDNCLMLVLHNPYGHELKSEITWQTRLHSDVNFRNYLDYVAKNIVDWTAEEEAKYNANLLSKEVQKMAETTALELAAMPKLPSRQSTAKSKKKDRPKSPGRKGSPDKPLSRSGSIKAVKEDEERQKAEDEERDRAKHDKRTKSGKRGGSGKETDKKRSFSRSSSPGKQPAGIEDVMSTPALTIIAEPIAPFWPFTGYDMGDNIIHVVGSTSVMFPSDGGQIRVETLTFTEGQNSIRVIVLKDGHIFTVNVLGPKDLTVTQEESADVTDVVMPTVEEAEKDKEEDVDNGGEEEEKEVSDSSEKDEVVLLSEPSPARAESADIKSHTESAVTFSESIAVDTARDGASEPSRGASVALVPPPGIPAAISEFSSFTARFSDGICLAFSVYGDSGEPVDGKPHQPASYKKPVERVLTPGPKEVTKEKPETPAKGRKGKEKAPEAVPVEEVTTMTDSESEVEVVEEIVPYQPFQQLFITCPDGLTVSYFLETAYGIMPAQEKERHLVVRQSYAFKMSGGTQECEAARAKAMLEVSRVITADGTVVKTMLDGTTEVLYANGTVASLVLHSPILPISRASTPPVRMDTESAKSNREYSAKKGKRKSAAARRMEAAAEVPEEETQHVERWHWIVTAPSGERFSKRKDGTHMTGIKQALTSVSTDPQTKQTMRCREDNVVMITYPDGSSVTEHADGTRITTYYKEIRISISINENNEDTTERWPCVLVECPGFANLHFHDGHCDTTFAGETFVRTYLDGRHIVTHSTGGQLTVTPDGGATYEQRDSAVVNSKVVGGYAFSHAAATLCTTVDGEGNTFTVQSGGECVVTRPADRRDGAFARNCGRHAPRLFIVRPDGGGTELLRYEDIAEYVVAAEEDPTTAVLTDPLACRPGVVGLTALRPITCDASARWLRAYGRASLVPPGLVHRDLTGLPPTEAVTPGPPFGTHAGRGLVVGGSLDAHTDMAPPACPKVLELRQILQHKPITGQLRQQLTDRLRRYAEFMWSRQRETEDLLMQDPRSEGERILAEDMASHYQATDWEEDADDVPPPRPSSVDEQDSLLRGDVRLLYERVTAPPGPSPPPTPQPKRTQADWEQDVRELADEADARAALQENRVPNYFASQLGKAFLLSQAMDLSSLSRELAVETQRGDGLGTFESTARLSVSDQADSPPQNSVEEQTSAPENLGMAATEALVARGSPEKSDSHEGEETPTPRPDGETNILSEEAESSDATSPATGAALYTSNGIRPENPTPGHAKGNGSPSNVRPLNPTPAHATKMPDRPGAPTPKDLNGTIAPANPEAAYPSIPEQPHEEQDPCTDLTVKRPGPAMLPSSCCDSLSRGVKENVVGEPRSDAVRVPAYFGSGRPGALPNIQFAQVEASQWRQVCTTSTVGAIGKGAAAVLNVTRRGFQLLPTAVNFGHLQEGATYTFTVRLKNVGIDTCRYRLRQPPPCTGLRVLYQPGPIAAGMKADLVIEIYAIAVGVEGESGIGAISHSLEIITEVEYLFLPITATVLTVSQHKDAEEERGSPLKPAPGVKLVSHKPPGSLGIIRPRKDDTRQQAVQVK